MDRLRAETLEIAADWADRFDELTEAERRELTVWLEEAREHAQAFARMRQLMTDTALIDALEQSGMTAEPLPPLRAPAAFRRSSRLRPRQAAPALARRQAIAAGLAGVLALPLAGYWLLRRGEETPQAAEPLRYASSVGKRRRLILPDGSGLLLDASSAVAVHFTGDRRIIALERGAARFDVRHDPARPFEVRTPRANMTALGTSFSVDHLSNASELRVFSGRVQLDAAGGDSLVVPARQWALVNGASVRTGSFDPAAHKDWQNDWLEADSMRLGFAIERLSRYSARPLRLDDPKLASMTFSGRFRLDTPEQSLELIGALFGLQVRRKDGAVYLEGAEQG